MQSGKSRFAQRRALPPPGQAKAGNRYLYKMMKKRTRFSACSPLKISEIDNIFSRFPPEVRFIKITLPCDLQKIHSKDALPIRQAIPYILYIIYKRAANG